MNKRFNKPGKPEDLTSEHPQIMMARTPYIKSNRELLKYYGWEIFTQKIKSLQIPTEEAAKTT